MLLLKIVMHWFEKIHANCLVVPWLCWSNLTSSQVKRYLERTILSHVWPVVFGWSWRNRSCSFKCWYKTWSTSFFMCRNWTQYPGVYKHSHTPTTCTKLWWLQYQFRSSVFILFREWILDFIVEKGAKVILNEQSSVVFDLFWGLDEAVGTGCVHFNVDIRHCCSTKVFFLMYESNSTPKVYKRSHTLCTNHLR